jgi:hypothetical protein
MAYENGLSAENETRYCFDPGSKITGPVLISKTSMDKKKKRETMKSSRTKREQIKTSISSISDEVIFKFT